MNNPRIIIYHDGSMITHVIADIDVEVFIHDRDGKPNDMVAPSDAVKVEVDPQWIQKHIVYDDVVDAQLLADNDDDICLA